MLQLKQELDSLADPEQAALLQRFFKTGKGQYGEGDIFLGIKVPEQRKVAKIYRDLSLEEIQELLNSKIHEHRLVALFILTDRYKRSDDKKEIVNLYLENTKNINNWDLVDSSAHKILGNHLLDNDRSVLYKLAKSSNLWERRISMIATLEFIAHHQFEDTLAIAEILLHSMNDCKKEITYY